ncbi:hypothetical protein U91I_02367 [alpha proteobacterium U9-1i]|nr:hypothetical protein U91I_02367 [alpha proteobacterium U9-1i]
MKTKLFAAALAAVTMLGAAIPAAADQYDRRHDERWRGRAEITIRNDGRTFSVDRGDRLFYRLLDRPYHFRPGLTYAYTDRCNRQGCVVFVFDDRSRRPIDRIFAPHLRSPRYAYREARDFDRGYNRFGRYDRDDRGWNNADDRNYRDGRGDRNEWRDDDRRDGDRFDGDRREGDRRSDDRRLEGGPR